MESDKYVTRDELQGYFADFHRDWAEMKAQWADMRREWEAFRGAMHTDMAGIRVQMADLKSDLAFKLPMWAFIGGLAGGLIAAIGTLRGG